MILSPTVFARQNLSGSNATLYTVPSGYTGEVKQITLINRDTSSTATVYLYFVPSGSTAGTENVFVNGLSLEPGEHFEWGTWQVLAESATIQGYALGDVTIHISGALTR